jgi:hypothetical protein
VTRGIGTLVRVRTKGLILTVCGLLLAAACGGGGGSAQPAPLVEKSYAISQGDAICKQGDADRKQLETSFQGANANPTKEAATDFFVSVYLPRLEREIGDIHRIGEPTKDRVAFDEAIRALDKGLTAFKSEVSADPLAALKGTTAFDDASKQFIAYGFKECGKP